MKYQIIPVTLYQQNCSMLICEETMKAAVIDPGGDFPRGDFHTLIGSIKTKLWPLGANISFIPGHGPMSTFGEEMRTNPFVSN